MATNLFLTQLAAPSIPVIDGCPHRARDLFIFWKDSSIWRDKELGF